MTDIGREKKRIRVEPGRRDAPIPQEKPAPKREKVPEKEPEKETVET